MSTLAAFPPNDYAVTSSRSSQTGNGIEFSFLTDPRDRARLASEQARCDAIDALLKLEPRYRERNWNGEGADPLPDAAFEEARVFLLNLPTTIPLPEVNAEPDGYLGLEWYANKWLNYVVSFNGTGTLSCSGLFDRLKAYGTWYMDDGIPGEILRMIARTVR